MTIKTTSICLGSYDNEHLDIRQTNSLRIKDILGENDRGLTKLVQFATALSETKLVEGRTPVELDTAVKELERLAHQAKKY